MANLRRPSSKDKDTVGRFKPNGPCKKHPKHRQSPGVCSLCLTEKLAQIPSGSSCCSSRSKTTFVVAGSSISSSVSSLSSYYSSSSASSCASPMHPNFAKVGKGGTSSLSIFLLSGGKHGLMKSKSLALVPRRRDGEKQENGKNRDHNKSAKKSGFWFKLLHPKSKRSMKEAEKDTQLVRSGSLRETVTIAN